MYSLLATRMHTDCVLGMVYTLLRTSDGNRFFCCGDREENAFHKGYKSPNLPKLAEFCHCFLLIGGKQVGRGRASD